MNIRLIKGIGITLLSITIVFYIIFLLVLPNIININKYKTEIKESALKNAKLNVEFSDAKLITTPSLKAGIILKNAEIKFTDNSELFSCKEAKVKISLLPLLLKELRVSNIEVLTPNITVDILPSNKLKLEELLLNSSDPNNQKETPLPIKLSNKLPNIEIENYSVQINDKKTNNNITLKGDYLLVDKAELNKHVRFKTNGKVLFNNTDNINFKIAVDTFLPTMVDSTQTNNDKNQFINPINTLISFDPKADIICDLKIKNRNKDIQAKGNLDIEKLSLKIGEKTLPDSFIKMNFSGNNVKINSSISPAENELITLKSDIKHGLRKHLKLAVKTENLNVKEIKTLIQGVLDTLNIQNDLNNINANGEIDADFAMETNFKNLKSNGKLVISNTNISHKIIPAKINNLNSIIDFSNNKVLIKDTAAVLNGSPFEIKGEITSDTSTNIQLLTNNLQVANLFNAFTPIEIKKSYHLNSGLLSVKANIIGKLNDLKPELKITLTNLNVKDLVNNIDITNELLSTNLTSTKKAYNGDILANNTKIKMPTFGTSINNQKIKIVFDNKDISILPADISFNSSPIHLEGKIKNYASKPEIKIQATGKIKSSDLIKILPKEFAQEASYSGQLPLFLNIKGNNKKISLESQIIADPNNYLSIITVNKLIGKPSILNASVDFENNSLNIKDIGLYELQNQKIINASGINNLSDSYKIAYITGKIDHVNKKTPLINNLKINLPASLSLSSPAVKNSKFTVKGNMNVNGAITSPNIKGVINISNVSLPELLTKIQNIDLAINDSIINAKIDNIFINESQLSIDADAKLDFASIFTITKMKVTSTNFDLDKIVKVAEIAAKQESQKSNSTQSSNAQIPVRIIKGSGKIDKFKMGDLILTDVSSPFNLNKNTLFLNEIQAKAYNGNITGNINYNLVTLGMKANLKGENIDANPAITAFLLIKDQLFGTLGFNANVSLRGDNYITQMKTLKGSADFHIKDGKMGSLGRFETFLKANNLLSQSFISTSLGSVINTIAPYNTGQFDYLQGQVQFGNGVTTINNIQSSGQNMALFMDGSYNMLNNNANIIILGRLSPKVLGVLGPIANLRADKIIGSIPKFGAAAMTIFQSFTTQTNSNELGKIPDLSPKTSGTQEFKVSINGNIEKSSAVKSFQWLSSSSEIQKTQMSLKDILKPQSQIKIPQTKEELYQQIQQNEKVQEKIQKIQQNENVQKIQQFGALFKYYSEESKNNSGN